MSTLWTPGGEHEVPRDDSPPTPAPASSDGAGAAAPTTDDISSLPGYDELTPEQQAQAQAMAEEMTQARQRLAEVPAAEVVANHAMGLYELAAIHLGGEPPALVEAQIAIDALAAMVAALPDRLGENEPVLREALQQLQMAFVQLSEAETQAGANDDDLS